MLHRHGTVEHMFVSPLDAANLSDSALQAALLDAIARRERAHADVIRLAGAWEQRGIWHIDASTSPVARLADLANIARHRAANDLALGKALLTMPLVEAALAGGRLGIDHVRELALARTPARTDAFAAQEADLVEAVAAVPASQAARVTRHWAALVDTYLDDDERREQIESSRALYVSEVGDLVIINGQLPLESGRIVIRALHALTGPPHSDDVRTPAQRRADAFVDMASYALSHGKVRESTNRRPHLNITIDLATLQSGRGVGSDDRGEPITATEARKLACDASISRVITDGPSNVLDVGRSTRTIPPATRTAIDLRDQHCQYPGCDRPAAWCDAHHIQHWTNGGATDRANLHNR